MFLKNSQYSQKTPILESSFNEALQLYQKETPTPEFSCEYCENFKSTYFEEYLQTVASDDGNISFK